MFCGKVRGPNEFGDVEVICWLGWVGEQNQNFSEMRSKWLTRISRDGYTDIPWYQWGLVPGHPADNKILGHSNLLYKMA